MDLAFLPKDKHNKICTSLTNYSEEKYDMQVLLCLSPHYKYETPSTMKGTFHFSNNPHTPSKTHLLIVTPKGILIGTTPMVNLLLAGHPP